MCQKLGRDIDFGRIFMLIEGWVSLEGRSVVATFKAKGEDQRLAFEMARRNLAVTALKQPCQPRHAGAILEIMKEAQLYEDYLDLMVERLEGGLESKFSLTMLPKKYEAWKRFPGVRPSSRILSIMFDIYYPQHKAELKAIYRDWINTWGDLDRRGYPRFLSYFAGQAMIPAVEEMWHRYVTRYPDVLTTMEGYRNLLHAYAQAGNQARIDELLDDIGQRGIEMDTSSVNVLIKCAIQRGDSAKSFHLYEQLRQSNMANAETYDLLMMAAAHKGDMASVRTLLDASQEQSIAVTEQMSRALVLVYCKNSRGEAAEKLCQEFAEHGLRDAQLWNMVIRLLGLQGKMTQCYEVMQRMRQYGVEWDGQTYEMLMIALVKVKQVQAAFKVLTTGVKNSVFLATAKHYEIIIVGAARVDYTMAQTVAIMMEKAGMQVTLPVHVALLEMAWERAPTAGRTRRLAKGLVEVVRSLAPAYQEAGPEYMQDDDRRTAALRPSDRQRVLQQMSSLGRGLNVLAQMREFEVVEEVMLVYLDMFPEHAKGGLPPAMVAGLMASFQAEGRSRRVLELWSEAMSDARERWQYANNAVFAAHQYDLCTPLMVAMGTYRKIGYIQGLAESIESMLEAGFRLTRSCWIMAVEYAAETETHWEKAMDWCEVMLMPNWRGWEPPRPQLALRRRTTTNRQELRPNTAIIVKLQVHWLQLRHEADWLAHNSERLQRIENNHPALYRAWITSHWRAQLAAWVLPHRPSLNEAISELLRPLTYDELYCMRRTLIHQLKDPRWQAEERDRPGGDSAFHIVDNAPLGPLEQGSTRPASAQDLAHLAFRLDSKLREMEHRESKGGSMRHKMPEARGQRQSPSSQGHDHDETKRPKETWFDPLEGLEPGDSDEPHLQELGNYFDDTLSGKEKQVSRGPAPRATEGPVVPEGAWDGVFETNEDQRDKITTSTPDADPQSVVGVQTSKEEEKESATPPAALGHGSPDTENGLPTAPADPADADIKTMNEELSSPPALGDDSKPPNPYDLTGRPDLDDWFSESSDEPLIFPEYQKPYPWMESEEPLAPPDDLDNGNKEIEDMKPTAPIDLGKGNNKTSNKEAAIALDDLDKGSKEIEDMEAAVALDDLDKGSKEIEDMEAAVAPDDLDKGSKDTEPNESTDGPDPGSWCSDTDDETSPNSREYEEACSWVQSQLPPGSPDLKTAFERAENEAASYENAAERGYEDIEEAAKIPKETKRTILSHIFDHMDPSPHYNQDHPKWRDEAGNPKPEITPEQQKESLYEYVDLIKKLRITMKEINSRPDQNENGADSAMSEEESERKKEELVAMFERIEHLSNMIGDPAPQELRKSLDITPGLNLKTRPSRSSASMSTREARQKKRRASRARKRGEGGGQ
ncbi:hypothetical protein CDD81_4729 [Ophiocordyceps australis]|uniref:Pentacotripeptide-repeat region of PRORP domain-containing protein n=1 Tax=Ophiocordyceps australis TaxID=1399860 RepID=A0A2C5X6Z0_9HYPO|nr:hypothetical protein CDD81_4729 [Ophiocordyceps australis]